MCTVYVDDVLFERIVNAPGSLSEKLVREAIIDAFHVWSDVSALSFTELRSGHADITVQFLAGSHGDGWPFDGPGDTHSRPHTMIHCIIGRTEIYVAGQQSERGHLLIMSRFFQHFTPSLPSCHKVSHQVAPT